MDSNMALTGSKAEIVGLAGRLRYTIRRTIKDMKRNKICYVMIAPFMLLFFVFVVIPVLSSLLLSFTYFDLIQPPKWIGLMNFKRMFLEDDLLIKAIINTLKFAFITGPISFFLCILFAWFINELSPRVRAFATFVFYIPSLSGSVFVVWKYIFSSDAYGLINSVLLKSGIIKDPVAWLIDPKYIMSIVIMVSLWLSLGASFLSNIAGLQTIDRSLYEAGAVDGIRNRWQELYYITLPQMAPFLMFGVVMQIAASFAAGNVGNQLAGYPQTDYAAHTVINHISEMGVVRYEMGYASAIALFLTLIMILTKQVIGGFLRRYGDIE